MGRIVSEECTKNAYGRLAKLLVWQGLREEERKSMRGRDGRKRWRRKRRKASQESRVLPPVFPLFKLIFAACF